MQFNSGQNSLKLNLLRECIPASEFGDTALNSVNLAGVDRVRYLHKLTVTQYEGVPGDVRRILVADELSRVLADWRCLEPNISRSEGIDCALDH